MVAFSELGATPVKEYVFLLRGDGGVARVKVQGTFLVLGRTSPVPLLRADRTMSREHAVLAATPSGIRLKDLGSQNGVLVGDERLAPYAEVTLAPGVRVVFGSTELVLMTEREANKRLDQPVDEVVVAPDGSTQVVRAQRAPTAEPDPLEDSRALEDSADGLETQEESLPGDDTADELEASPPEPELEPDAPDEWVEDALTPGEAAELPEPGTLTELDVEATELEVRGDGFAELELPQEDDTDEVDPVEQDRRAGVSRVALTEIEIENVLERGGEATRSYPDGPDEQWQAVERELADLDRREPNLE
ncbi:MAG: FHA domain-containing protein [Planctomycetota bacterium]